MKKIAKLSLLTAAAIMLTACGQSKEAISPESQTTTENEAVKEQVEVTVEDGVEEETTAETASIDPADYVGYYNNEANDVMEITAAGDGTYEIEIFLYRLWSFDKTELTAEGDKLVFTSEDGQENPVKGAVYPDGDSLTVELLDANWTYFKTGDKFTGFTLTDTSEPLLNGAGEYFTTLAVGENPENYDNIILQEYSFEGQTLILTASYGYYPTLDEAGTLSDMLLNIETTTAELPLDDAYFYTAGGDAGEQPMGSFEEFKEYLAQVQDSGLGLVIRIEDNKVVSVGITS